MHLLFYYLIAFGWAILAGFIFSSIGAAGAILASFGFISLLRINDANSVKAMSLVLVIISAIFAIISYLRQERIKKIKKVLFYVGSIIAAGGIAGAFLGSWFSKTYLSRIGSFKYLFGYLTFVVAILMLYNMGKKNWNKRTPGSSVGNFENGPEKVETPAPVLKTNTNVKIEGANIKIFSLERLDFNLMGVKYSLHPVLLFIAGFFIAGIASSFGLGGGFLIVPFLTDFIAFPLFLAAGTSIFVVFIASVVAASNYLRMDVHVIPGVLIIEIAGVAIGSVIGPGVSRHLSEKRLRYLLIVLLVFIGIFYVFNP